MMWTEFSLDSPVSPSSRIDQVLKGQGHTKAQIWVPFSESTGKKSQISLQEGLVGYFASETPKVPAPASPLRHKALWGLSAERKLPQISKTGLEADGRPLKFHSPGFCEYSSLETDHSNTGRFGRRTKVVGLIFIERQPRSSCLSCLLKQAEGKIMTS